MSGSWRLPLSLYPGMNRFVLDWMAGEQRATRFLPRGDGAHRSGARGDAALATALEESNRAWGIDARKSVRRWRDGEAFTIVTGQQVGFAGGPLYTLAKLATVVRMRRELESQGVPATAFFWLATEDHDFHEVAAVAIPVAEIAKEKQVDRRCDLLCTRAARTADARTAVGSLAVPESLITALLQALDMPRPRWLREGVTFRDSFAELIATLFGDEVVLVDALLPELRAAGAPLFETIQLRRDEVQQTLQHRGAELAAAGYQEQVVARDGAEYTLLFALDERDRRIPLAAGAPLGGPARISTSAITRPLLQDAVLRPDIFVGGPAEVAYYAQIRVLHELLEVPMPRVALRGHVLVAPPAVARAIEKWEIEPAAVFSTPEEILASREPAGMARIEEIAHGAKLDLMRRVEEIRELALPADRALSSSIERSVGHLDYHFDQLTRRAVRALLRREKDRWSAACAVVSALYPDRQVQERTVSWLPYWGRFGRHLLDRILEEIEPDANGFRIVGL